MVDEPLERTVRRLTVDQAETRWLALRVDSDIRDVREELREHTSRFDAIDATLLQHMARFDSIDMQLRSLTQLIGDLLKRLPELPK